VLVSDENY